MCSAIAGCAATSDEEAIDSSSDELRKCADGTTVRGIDVSKYQGNVDWAKVKASGKAFAFARVSDGNNSPDAKFAQNWPAMKSAGLVRGAYQYFRASQDATKQANLLIDKIVEAGGLHAGDLPPVLDLEQSDGAAAATVLSRAKTWLALVEAKFGVKPIVYTGNNMSSVTKTTFSSYLLWVPNYGASCPLMPSGWTNWTFWQDSQTGSCSGVSGAVDTDYFNGSLDKLKELALQAEPVAREIAIEPEEDFQPGDSPSVPDDAVMGSSFRAP
jgi:lysozyme